MIPRWLQGAKLTPYPGGSVGTSGRSDFVEKTVTGILAVFQQVVFSEAYAKKPGLMQRVDPRVKLATIGGFVVSLSIVKRVELVLVAYVLTLILAYYSQIEVLFFVKRVWFFVPLFTALIAIPAIFNFVTPGKPLVVLFEMSKSYQFGPWNVPKLITITEPGVKGAVLFTARAATSVSAVVLLTLTTVWNDLLRSLRVFRVPAIFVMVLGMTYRYIVLFLRTVEEMHLAKKSRTITKLSARENRSWVAARIASTFKKSVKLYEDVYLAMTARGFSGEPRTLGGFAIRGIDIAWLGGAVLACGALILFTMGMGA